MGNQLARTTQASPSEYYLQDLPSTYNLVLKEVLGGGRIFKSVQCVHDEGLLLVKVYFKRGEFGPDLKEHDRRLRDIQTRLKNLEHSHVWPFQTWLETDKAAYLLRQFFFNNLHDRISTRPFLSLMEKKWLAFQLIYAVKQCHERGVCHGDIKCENVLVTSWNWVYLADFASFKPTYLPADNPSDFSFFFDTGGRRRCYLAPERFYDPSSDPPVSADAPLKPALDIFSIGCVIAELFLEGQELFDLSQLLAYRKGQYDPRPSLGKIPDERIQEMILHMIQLNPTDRFSPDEYLKTWTPAVFPSYFSPLLHKFFSCLIPLDTDTRVAATQRAFPEIHKQMMAEVLTKKTAMKGQDRSVLREIGNADSSEGDGGKAFDFSRFTGQEDLSVLFAATKFKANGVLHRVKAAGVAMAYKQNSSKVPGEEMFIYKMEPAEGAYMKVGNSESQGLNSLRRQQENSIPRFEGGLDIVIPVAGGGKNGANSLDQQSKCEGMILIAALLCACLRNVRLPQARRGAIQLLHEASRYCDNDARLQHVLPYVVALLSDPAAIVRCAALQTLCNLLSMVENFPPSDAKIFPEYILPLLSMLPDDSEESVRIVYANNIHKIARASYRFLVSSQYQNEIDSPGRSQKATAPNVKSHDAELSHLRETIARVIQELVMGHKQTPTIGRALLQHVGSLCPFFGQKQSNDFLLPILPAFLNDRDEQLRAVFFEHIVHVCLFVGQASLEAYLLPYIEQALSDVEETVIVNALECLAALCVHRLLRKRVVLEAVERASPLLCHPSQCVQRAAVTFVAATSAALEPVDTHAYLSHILRPFLRREPASLCSENAILVCLKPPVSREVFNRVLSDVMLSQTLQETGAVKLRTKGRQRVALIQSAPDFGGNQSLVSNSERQKADKEAGGSLAVSQVSLKAAPARKSSAVPRSPFPNQGPSAAANEDQEKMKAMEGYIRNLSSTMQTRMHTWEAENTEKLESSAVGLPPGVGAGYYSHYDGSSEGIPLYSVPLPERRAEGAAGQSNLLAPGVTSYNEDWSRIFGTQQPTPFRISPGGASLGPASSQWAAIASHRSNPTGESMQRSIANVPIAPRFMAGSIYHAGSTTGPRRAYDAMREGGRDGEGGYITSQHGRHNIATASEMGMGMQGFGLAPPIEPTFEIYPAPDSVTALLGSTHIGQSAIDSSWKPKGVLIANLQEHQRAVNEVSVSSDHTFFVSGSDDGTVKVWDSRRLERDISFRSRLTYTFPAGRVLCVKLLSDGHQVAAATSSGTLLIMNVDYQARLGGSNERYTGFYDIRKLESKDGAILSLQNYIPEGPPILLYSTQRNGTHLWDLRGPNETWVLRGQPAQGYISATALDPNCHWLVTGTSRGVLTLWDLRFQIPVNIWQHPLGCPVETMCPLLPRMGTVLSATARPFIYVAAGQDEVALWNAEDGSCHQVMRLAPDADTERRDIPAALSPPTVNLEFGPGTTWYSSKYPRRSAKDYRMEELNEPPPRLGGVRALLPLAGGTGLLSGGTDCRVRMWDRLRPEHSYTVCGPNGKSEEKVAYEATKIDGVRVIEELIGGERNAQGRRSPATKNGLVAAALDCGGCHRDTIRFLAAAQVNQKILISGGRDGAIKVWK